jgi:hypothetical protein
MNRRVGPDGTGRVSAVLPFFNHGTVIDEAVRSLRLQSRPVDQTIVVDDGSTDPFSLAVLRRLEGEGITVVRQENAGPGAARNLGVAHADGDAILFLDSDDVVTEHHVALAVAALAEAPEEVGFTYPDMQFMGNEHHLVVMPPYNLYLLLHRNFCCMGGVIDAAVFEAGFAFRSDRLVGHEDWDFFVSLGLHGIFGRPFHGAPLGYRRWGYSRSDGVAETGSGLAHMRVLHPGLDDDGRLLGIKAEWVPALSVVAPAGGGQTVAEQTCGDFELVRPDGVQPPATRGRWVILLDPSGVAALGDRTFVERVIRLVGGQKPSAPVALRWRADARTGWRRSAPAAGPPFAVVAEGHFYQDWRRGVPDGANGLTAFVDYLTAMTAPAAPWECGRPAAAADGVALAAFRSCRPPPPPPLDEVAMSGSEVERAFRHHEARPLFLPEGGRARFPTAPDASDEAWAEWRPARAVRLDLVVDLHGASTLEVGAGPAPTIGPASARGPARVPLGWIWSQPFPGTACLLARRDGTRSGLVYDVAGEAPPEPGVAVLGHVPVAHLPGRIALRRALEGGGRLVEGPATLTLPHLTDPAGASFVEFARAVPRPAASAPVTDREVVEPPPAGPHAGETRWWGRHRRPR